MDKNIAYGKFWDRAAAYILDGIILGTITIGLNYVNVTQFKSFAFYLPIALIGILYKPFLESYYGATLGKMALNLKVTDLDYNNIGFEKSLLRSLIVIAPSLLYIPIYYLAFNNPSIANTNGFMDFSYALSATYPATTIFTNIISLVFFVDLIVLLVDGSKKQRSLKDFIAKTYVIKVKE